MMSVRHKIRYSQVRHHSLYPLYFGDNAQHGQTIRTAAEKHWILKSSVFGQFNRNRKSKLNNIQCAFTPMKRNLLLNIAIVFRPISSFESLTSSRRDGHFYYYITNRACGESYIQEWTTGHPLGQKISFTPSKSVDESRSIPTKKQYNIPLCT